MTGFPNRHTWRTTPWYGVLHSGMKTVTQRELVQNSPELMNGLERGEEYLITRNGRLVGHLEPARSGRAPRVADLQALLPKSTLEQALQARLDVNAVLGEDSVRFGLDSVAE